MGAFGGRAKKRRRFSPDNLDDVGCRWWCKERGVGVLLFKFGLMDDAGESSVLDPTYMEKPGLRDCGKGDTGLLTQRR